ncbi:MAG: CvpA family protein [Planctomycetaceae bacterium]|nr:CvpA family protein [Planctomycetaceae bacterium]
MIDLALLAIVGLVAWCVASEGAWGAALALLSTLLAGFLAMNYFEPLADLLAGSLNLGASWRNRWDFIALMGLFIALIFAFRLGTEQIMPTFIHVHPIAHDGVRWAAGIATGYLTMAVILTSLHTSPLPRTFLGFEPERDNLLGMAAPDRQWIGYVQYLTEKSFSRDKTHFFDGSTVRLANNQEVVIPSFTIRYATRRGVGGVGGAAQEAPPAQVVPVPVAPNARPPVAF